LLLPAAALLGAVGATGVVLVLLARSVDGQCHSAALVLFVAVGVAAAALAGIRLLLRSG
jgi:hypothetical protein